MRTHATATAWFCAVCITVGLPSPAAAQTRGEGSSPGDGLCEHVSNEPRTTPMVIQFEADSDEIRPQERERLSGFGKRLLGSSSGQVCILGRPDLLGDTDYNEALARRRAEAVAAEIRQACVDPADVIVEVPELPIGALSVFETASVLNADRRVEVILLEQVPDP